MSLSKNEEESELKIKGQEILEGNCGVCNSPKKSYETFSLISALASKKWSNQKNKGTRDYNLA